MGVPAFYRWLSTRYPKCVVDCIEEHPVVINGVEIPVDLTQPSPNGHVDNLYLDMNGIIHPCFHPDNKRAPLTFDECFQAIFEYIDRIVALVRPRKLLYMAIDGVAPRAKMNQQRGRRFKSAKETQERMEEEKRIRAELKAEGKRVREEVMMTPTGELSDSNIITPGTAFMAKLSVALQYYIHQRINSSPAWKSIVVMLSDANVPGEGEHKIMEYIREQRGRPGYDPNLTHVVSGLDADLIHLALATHEPKFYILREMVMGPPPSDNPEGAKARVPYQYLKISVLRDYLALEFNDVRLPFEFDKERIYDDFVFLCFFVGNDFLPHSPTLDIREGGIDLLMTIYKRQLRNLGGYLCIGSKVNLKRVEVIIREVARYEERILQKRMRVMKNQENKRKSNLKRPLTVDVPPAPVAASNSNHMNIDPASYSKGTPKKQRTEEEDTTPASSTGIEPIEEEAMAVDSQKLWDELAAVDPTEKAEHILPVESSESESDDEVEQLVRQKVKDSAYEKADMFDSMIQHGDSIQFGQSGWKDRYYRMKFPEVGDRQRKELIQAMTEKFVEGLSWVMAYYYEGVASWTWYYPYHYAPFASDMLQISHVRPKFDLGEPFLPVNQLMAVLPAASRFCLPQCLQHLFVDPDSPIIDFYPTDFKCDMNGKRFAWQAVVLLPFIDEKRLTETTKQHFSEFTDEEKERNVRKLTQFYVGDHHPLAQFIHDAMNKEGAPEVTRIDLEPEKSDGMNGFVCIGANYCPETISTPLSVGEDISHNRVCMASFQNPPHQRHLSQLMEGVVEEETGVTQYDIPPEQEMWHEHPRPGNNPVEPRHFQRPQFSIDKEAAHRFVVHGLSQPRFRDEAPQRGPSAQAMQKSTLRADAPAFVPDQVTQWALLMTGQAPRPAPMVRPPLTPPEAVTHAAIQLNERVCRQQGRPIQPPSPQMQLQNLLFQQQQQQQLLNQIQGGGLLPFPVSPTINAGPQPEGVNPMMRPNVPPLNLFPGLQPAGRPFAQTQSRPEFSRGGFGYRPRGRQSNNDPGDRQRKRKP